MDARLAEATTRASGNPKRPSGQRSRESEDVLSPEPTPAPRSALHNGKAKILLVDDRPANLLAYQVILEELGEELIMVQSGEEALRTAAHPRFCGHPPRRHHARHGRL